MGKEVKVAVKRIMADIPGTQEEKRKRRLIEQAQYLLRGLERISADSIWAHRSSGCRGALLRQLERWEAGQNPSPEALDSLERLVQTGYEMLIKAAREIGGFRKNP